MYNVNMNKTKFLLLTLICSTIGIFAVNIVSASFYPVLGVPYSLSRTAAPTDATITLSSFKANGTTLTMANFGSIGYGTLDPESNSKAESISFTGVTANVDGTVTLTGVSRGLAFTYPYAASVSYSTTHLVGAHFLLSNTPSFYSQFATLANNISVNGLWNFVTSPTAPTPTTSTQVATKGYADSLSYNGAPNGDTATKGVYQTATGLQMASSTALGSTGASLAITSAYATSTYNSATAPLKVVVTQNDGKIDSNFIRQSDNFTWSGNNTHSGSETFTSTTTFSGAVTGANSYFGNGTDSASTTSGTVTLSRNMYFTNYTIANGTTVNTNGYIIYASGYLVNNGTIQNNGGAGGNASGTTGGIAGAIAPGGYLKSGSIGFIGGTGGTYGGADATSGTSGTSINPALGVAGVAGAKASQWNNSPCLNSYTLAGGAGSITAENAYLNFSGSVFSAGSEISTNPAAIAFGTNSLFTLSSSAGSGSGAGGNAGLSGTGGGGGGSGASGGIVEIFANNLINTGTISANGGNGGNGAGNTGVSATGGGGGAGSGGVIVLGYKNYTNSGTVSANGGTGGSGGGAPSGCGAAPSGSNGNAGNIYRMKIY